VEGRPCEGPIFHGIGGMFPLANDIAVQTAESVHLRFQFMIPASNAYFQTQPQVFRAEKILHMAVPWGVSGRSFRVGLGPGPGLGGLHAHFIV
jgi:hypothetical protein